MLEVSERRCVSTKAAVSPQQSWKSFIRELILPRLSSRERERSQRLFIGDQTYHSQEEEEEEGSNSSSSSSSEEVRSNCNDVPFRINERLRCIGCNKRRPSFSDTESILDIVKMPVGTTNPVLKSSFSLTSLRSSTPTDSPEHCVPLRLKTERAYNSLTKKSRKSSEQDKEQWRKSWGSGISQDGKEFWEVFQADYDYLMAQNILDRDIPEVPVENGIPRAPPAWSHSEFMDNFAQLYSWLKGIQDSVYGKEENVTDWKLRAERLEDMQRQRFRLENFKEESKKLIGRNPDYDGEVLWRVKHITDKWETVEAMMGGCQKCEGEKGSEEKIKHEIRCLRKWLKELDTKLKPLSFQRRWTKAELEAKSKELMVLHRDIEAHNKIISSLLKVCKKEKKSVAIAEALQRKFFLHYLRNLEWQYHIESLINQQNKNSSNVSIESDGEPVCKIARFAGTQNPEDRCEIEDSDDSNCLRADDEFFKDDDWQMDISIGRTDAQAPAGQSLDTMVGAGAERSDGFGGSSLLLGTNSKNANISFSCANHGTDSTPASAGHGLRDNRLRDVNAAVEPEINRWKEKPPNTGSFTCRHLDTDSEQEKPMSDEEGKGKKASEDGWPSGSPNDIEKSRAGAERKSKAAVRLVFKNDDGKEMKHFSAKNIPPLPGGEEPISSRKLVELADKLVRRKPVKTWKTRRGRLRRGSKEKVLDSCDASGEYTEDSDVSQKSDNEGSFVYIRRFGSADGIMDKKNSPEVVHRRRGHQLRRRPWSMSSVSCWTPRSEGWRFQGSMSESALNQMKGSRTMGVEDGNGGSARRRRGKFRKQMNKRSNSGSDGLTLSGSDSPNVTLLERSFSTLVKSGSFSGVTKEQREVCGFESATGTETEELKPPVFRLGPEAGAVTVTAEQDKAQVEEQLSLNWDSYQEKYQSEAFSEEPPDSDTAKKLWEFGEDYGKFLGNQSDCASSRSRSFTGWTRSDSDVDEDEIIEAGKRSGESLSKLLVDPNVEMLPVKEHNTPIDFKPNKKRLIKKDQTKSTKAEVKGILLVDFTRLPSGQKIIEVGGVFLASDPMTSLLSSLKVQREYLNPANMVSVQVQTDYVKESWDNLKSTADLHKAKHLRREMTLLKDELLSLAASVDAMETTVTSREELEAKITQVQNELNLMRKGKNRLLQANVSVHRFLASAKHSDYALRDEVTELYQLWDQTYNRVSSQLCNLQSLSQTWHDFDDHLTQLQCALRTDTLKVLDFALKCGNSSSGATLSLQDIAGILSDKEPSEKKDPSAAEVPDSGKPTIPVLASLSTEGSLSDSGISDSGSEQELSEREKRLAQLKRLAKRLEGILAPGSQALSNMFKRIEEAESELRELQKTCRDLIVRSMSAEDIKMIVANTPALGKEEGSSSAAAPRTGKRGKSPALVPLTESADGDTVEEEADSCDGGKPGKKFWFWRLLRYALPFQLALVALLCIASIMEPRCCDSLNNLELSLNPQLRYDSGPPPV